MLSEIPSLFKNSAPLEELQKIKAEKLVQRDKAEIVVIGRLLHVLFSPI